MNVRGALPVLALLSLTLLLLATNTSAVGFVVPLDDADSAGPGHGSDAYLGQAPPGIEPKIYAPGFVFSEDILHCYPTFTPDGREMYWMELVRGKRPKIMTMRATDSGWTAPEVASFSGEYIDQAPHISADGRRLYFASVRPGGYGKADIWYVERLESGWGEPVNLGSPPNSEGSETQPSVTGDGTLYFVAGMEGVKWNRGIYVSRMVDGRYSDPKPLPEMINSEHADIYPFIAYDESYLLFGSTRPGGNSVETDIYVCFRQADGSWPEGTVNARVDQRLRQMAEALHKFGVGKEGEK